MKYRDAVIIFFILLISISFSCAQEEITRFKEYKYYEGGGVRECTVYNSSGKVLVKAMYDKAGIVERTEQYDDLGNKIEAALYDEKGRLRKGPDGWAAMRWRYDGQQAVSQISYDENGKPIEKKFYSESGRLLARLYKDDDDARPYEDASMHILLGSRNIKLQDSGSPLQDKLTLSD